MSKTTIHVVGITANLILILVLGLFIFLAFKSHSDLNECETSENPNCYTITCPNTAYKPCGTAAYREANGQIYCSTAPKTPVGSS